MLKRFQENASCPDVVRMTARDDADECDNRPSKVMTPAEAENHDWSADMAKDHENYHTDDDQDDIDRVFWYVTACGLGGCSKKKFSSG